MVVMRRFAVGFSGLYLFSPLWKPLIPARGRKPNIKAANTKIPFCPKTSNPRKGTETFCGPSRRGTAFASEDL